MWQLMWIPVTHNQLGAFAAFLLFKVVLVKALAQFCTSEAENFQNIYKGKKMLKVKFNAECSTCTCICWWMFQSFSRALGVPPYLSSRKSDSNPAL